MDKNLDLQKELSDHLNRISIFESLWNLHNRWIKGVLLKEVLATGSTNIHLGFTKDPYYNYATPSVENPDYIDLEVIERQLDIVNLKSGFYLLEDHQKQGFIEFLLRNKYKLDSREAWVMHNPSYHNDYEKFSEIFEVTSETFKEYYDVLVEVLDENEHKEDYLELHRKTLSSHIESAVSDLDSKLYIIYENEKPVAGAGMFFSVAENFAYLHTAGTKIPFRNKGYQSELIKFRIDTAHSLGITRIYSQTVYGSTSWSNLIKNGFQQLCVGEYYLR